MRISVIFREVNLKVLKIILIIIALCFSSIGIRYTLSEIEARLTHHGSLSCYTDARFKLIESALELYKLDNLQFPTSTQGLQALIEKPVLDPLPKNYAGTGYLKNMPLDDWGNFYNYDLIELGADTKILIYSSGGNGTKIEPIDDCSLYYVSKKI